MQASKTRRAGAAVSAALCLAVAATACGGDRTKADTTMAMDTTAMAPAPSGAMAGEAGAMTDAQVVTQVSASNAAEIAAGTVGADKATAADVKSFARKMVEDHQRLQGQLDSLATRLAIAAAPPQTDTLADAFAARRDALKGEAAGKDWDRSFMDLQVRMHESTLDLLNRAVSSTQNADLRGALQQAVTVVQGHLDQGRQILSGLGGPAADTAAAPRG